MYEYEYEVVNLFREKYHDDHIYKVDDPYPAPGKQLDEERAEFLTKKHAKYGMAFLRKVKKTPAEKPAAKSSTRKASPKKELAEKPAEDAKEAEKSDD